VVLLTLARVSGNEPGPSSRASGEAAEESKLEQAAADGQRAGAPPRTAVRVRDGLVVVLALTSGAVDAVTFVRLGNVFSSVITGNLALLGLAVGERHGALAGNSGLALAAYAAGVLAGGALAGPIEGGQPAWPRRTTVTMAAELVVLAGFSAGWLAAGGHPSGGVRMTLLALTAAAMGMQSAAVRLLGQMSTTYLTSTLIGIFQSLAVRRVPQDWHRSTGVLLAFVAGAALGVAGAVASPVLVPVVVMLPLAAVVLCAARSAALRQPRVPAGHSQGPAGHSS
jgi:uncharacterized membrane protein YoaK (UPF0700 family)